MSNNRNETAAVADVFAERVRHNQGRLRAKLSPLAPAVHEAVAVERARATPYV